jgi:hypothetical protein
MFAERLRLCPTPVGIEVSRRTLHFGVVDQSALPIGSIVGFPTGEPWIHHSAVTITTAAEGHSMNSFSETGRFGIARGSASPLMARIKPAAGRVVAVLASLGS